MTDIVERLAEHLYGHSREKAIEWAKEDKFDSCYRQAEDIIELLGVESLRQRVKELDRSLRAAKKIIEAKEAIAAIQEDKLKNMNEAIYTLASEREANAILTNELAALKQGQGEPVAYLHKWKPHANTIGRTLHFVRVSPHGDDVEITPLYTSAAQSIPEGWQLVPVEPTPEMIAARVGFYDGGRTNAEYSCIAGYKAMLSAAPKHTKEAG